MDEFLDEFSFTSLTVESSKSENLKSEKENLKSEKVVWAELSCFNTVLEVVIETDAVFDGDLIMR